MELEDWRKQRHRLQTKCEKTTGLFRILNPYPKPPQIANYIKVAKSDEGTRLLFLARAGNSFIKQD
jgi:hypothetical protein